MIWQPSHLRMQSCRKHSGTKNGWFDEHGNVYIYFTIDEIQRKMRCSRSKAVKLKKILLKEKLIRYEQKGKSDPHRIYVLPFFYGSEIRPVKSDNQTLGGIDNELHEVRISNPNNTENNKTESNNINPSTGKIDGYDKSIVIDILKRNIEYEVLAEREYDMDVVDNLVEIMADTICGNESAIRIGSQMLSKTMVRSRFMKMSMQDIQYILKCLEDNPAEVKNIRNYLLTVLYNAPSTRIAYYRQKAWHEMSQYADASPEGGMIS